MLDFSCKQDTMIQPLLHGKRILRRILFIEMYKNAILWFSGIRQYSYIYRKAINQKYS